MKAAREDNDYIDRFLHSAWTCVGSSSEVGDNSQPLQ